MKRDNKKIIILMPFFLLLGIFLLDKLVLLPYVHNRLVKWDNYDDYFFQSRETLFQQMKKSLRQRPLSGIVFGTSRLLSFSPLEFPANTRDGIYNFSAPGASPEYYYFWYERIKNETGSKPGFVIIEFDTPMFNKKTNYLPLAHSYNLSFLLRHLAFSGEPPFRLQNFNSITGGTSSRDILVFLQKRAMLTASLPLDLSALLNSGDNEVFLNFRKSVIEQLNLDLMTYHGSFPQLYNIQNNPLSRNRHSAMTIDKYIRHFSYDGSQKYFLYKLLDALAKDSVKTVVFWPPGDPVIQQAMQEKNLVTPVQNELVSYMEFLKNRYNFQELYFLDVFQEPEFTCKTLIDSHHLTGKCQSELSRYLYSRYFNNQF